MGATNIWMMVLSAVPTPQVINVMRSKGWSRLSTSSCFMQEWEVSDNGVDQQLLDTIHDSFNTTLSLVRATAFAPEATATLSCLAALSDPIATTPALRSDSSALVDAPTLSTLLTVPAINVLAREERVRAREVSLRREMERVASEVTVLDAKMAELASKERRFAIRADAARRELVSDLQATRTKAKEAMAADRRIAAMQMATEVRHLKADRDVLTADVMKLAAERDELTAEMPDLHKAGEMMAALRTELDGFKETVVQADACNEELIGHLGTSV